MHGEAAGIAANVVSMPSTPTKRRKLTSTPSLESIASAWGRPVRTPEKPEKAPREVAGTPTGAESKACARPLDERCAVLSKLFAGLEDVLVLFSKRGRRPALAGEAGVKSDVEGHTRRDLSDERLQHILALADGMLEAVWLGSGASASLELVQRAEDGEARPPTLDEQAKRRARFDAALADAASGGGKLPSQELPPRPSSPWTVESSYTSEARESSPVSSAGSAAVAGAPPHSGVPTAAGRSMEDRIQAIKMRMLARQEAERKQAALQAAIRDLEHQCAVCEDAMALQPVLEMLFARGKGTSSAATEVELLSAATSSCYSAQFRRPMDREVACAALACLTARSAEWYRVEAAVHSRSAGSFLRRIAGGSSKAAMEALKAELQALKAQRSALLDGSIAPPTAAGAPAAPAATPASVAASAAAPAAAAAAPASTSAVSGGEASPGAVASRKRVADPQLAAGSGAAQASAGAAAGRKRAAEPSLMAEGGGSAQAEAPGDVAAGCRRPAETLAAGKAPASASAGRKRAAEPQLATDTTTAKAESPPATSSRKRPAGTASTPPAVSAASGRAQAEAPAATASRKRAAGQASPPTAGVRASGRAQARCPASTASPKRTAEPQSLPASAARASSRAKASAEPVPAAPPARRRRGSDAATVAEAEAVNARKAAESRIADAMAVAAAMPGPVTRRRLRMKLDLDLDQQ